MHNIGAVTAVMADALLKDTASKGVMLISARNACKRPQTPASRSKVPPTAIAVCH